MPNLVTPRTGKLQGEGMKRGKATTAYGFEQWQSCFLSRDEW